MLHSTHTSLLALPESLNLSSLARHEPLLRLLVPADLRRGVCSALSGPGRGPGRDTTHATSHPTPVVSHYDRDAVCHSMTNSL